VATIVESLGDYAVGLRFDDPPPDVVHQLERPWNLDRVKDVGEVLKLVTCRGLAAAVLFVALVGGLVANATAQPKPQGEMRWALYVTLAPVWYDPGEAGGLTAFWISYGLHDALVKPMPGNLMTPSLAESWTVSPCPRSTSRRSATTGSRSTRSGSGPTSS
jgi:hypothetical protein